MNGRFTHIAGSAMSGLVVAFMLLDGALKLIPLDVVIKSTVELGFPPSVELIRGIGLIAILCAALYAFPPTAIVGAILISAYMGGTVATHVRISNPLFTHVLFGPYLAVLAWGGLYLRDPRIKALVPWRKADASNPTTQVDPS